MAKRKSRKRDKRKKPVSPGSTATTPHRLDYSGFGPHGPSFQRRHELRRELFRERWSSLAAGSSKKLTRKNLAKVLHRAFFWFQYFQIALTLESDATSAASRLISSPPPIEGQNAALWKALRGAFSPTLKEELLKGDAVAHSLEVANALTTVESEASIEERFESLHLTETCYGPFSRVEMDYLLERHSRLVEMGAGSGYFAAHFRERGGDVFAIDANRYQLSTPSASPWVEELQAAGCMTIGDVDLLGEHADRTLLISWPEPGSDFAARALEAYRLAGGRHFLLKLGGLMGRFVPAQGAELYEPPTTPRANVVRFLRELSTHWIESSDSRRPAYAPLANTNNLWVFRIRA